MKRPKGKGVSGMIRRAATSAVIGIMAFLTLSCGKKGVPYDNTPAPSTRLEIVRGNDQAIAAGQLLDSLKVRVIDSDDQPVPDITVRFQQTTPDQGGKFPPGSWFERTTNEAGYAYTFYFVDTVVGVDTIMAVAAAVDDSVSYFAATVFPGAAQAIKVVSGASPPQSTIAGQPLPAPCVVKVVDRYMNGVPNHRVVFITESRCLVTTDSSLLQPLEIDTAYTRTDQSGQAQVQWIMTINPVPGFGYPSSSRLFALRVVNDSLVKRDTATFLAITTDPGPLEYYNDLRPLFEEHCFACHSGPVRQGYYAVDFYYELFGNGNLIPGDTNSPLLSYANASHQLVHFNMIDEDEVINWVVYNNAAPGASGLNNYTTNMKAIFDVRCVFCHNSPTPDGDYLLATHAGIRGNGSDGVPNAIPGDSASLLVQILLPSIGTMRSYLGPDSVALADSLIRWVVRDSLRDF